MKKQPRKTRRQLQAEKLTTAQKKVDDAINLKDPLQLLDNFPSYKLSNNAEVKLACQSVRDMNNHVLTWIYSLFEKNMKEMYEKSSWGWDIEKKMHELTEEPARYLIARIGDTKVGFSHFRFDLDDGVDVLYCYELQLLEEYRRKGIGKYMMKALEAIAKKCGLQKVVLTVFKHNASANYFFSSLGYKTDITNPSESHKVDYTILSKRC